MWINLKHNATLFCGKYGIKHVPSGPEPDPETGLYGHAVDNKLPDGTALVYEPYRSSLNEPEPEPEPETVRVAQCDYCGAMIQIDDDGDKLEGGENGEE